MGYERERFVGEIYEELICKFCNNILENPKQLECEHIFCLQCIEEQAIEGGYCILDKMHIDAQTLREPQNEIQFTISQLKIKCDFNQFGCQEIIDLSFLKIHRMNCEFHPQKKSKCTNCGVIKPKMQDHNCFEFLTQAISNLKVRIDTIEEKHSKELELMRAKEFMLKNENDQLNCIISSMKASQEIQSHANEKPWIRFSCFNELHIGSREQITIHSKRFKFKCDAHGMTKIGQIKYYASTLLRTETNEVSLYFNGMKLDDNNTLSHYHIHSGSQLHLLPDLIYILFDCIDIKAIIGLSLKTSDTIGEAINKLIKEAKHHVTNKIYYEFFSQNRGSLFLNESKLEETYQLSNYDVYSLEILKYQITYKKRE